MPRENRTEMIKARVRPDELVIIEYKAAQSNRTISELIRDTLLTEGIAAASGLTAIDRHDLSRIALLGRTDPDTALDRLQAFLERQDELVEG